MDYLLILPKRLIVFTKKRCGKKWKFWHLQLTNKLKTEKECSSNFGIKTLEASLIEFKISVLAFADDVVSLAETRAELQEIVKIPIRETKGLGISDNKTIISAFNNLF